MAEERRIINTIAGTPPSPEDPYPSNLIIVEYSDDTSMITTGPLTPEVLAEYVAALAEHPEDAGLHLHYGIALQGAQQPAEALTHFQEAVRLDPTSQFALSMLASGLRDAGRVDEALHHGREALRSFLLKSAGSPDQQEAILLVR